MTLTSHFPGDKSAAASDGRMRVLCNVQSFCVLLSMFINQLYDDKMEAHKKELASQAAASASKRSLLTSPIHFTTVCAFLGEKITYLSGGQFFLFLYCEKSFICLEDKSMTPRRGKHFSLPFLPDTPSSPSRTLEGLFELTRRPSRALDSPHALLPEP